MIAADEAFTNAVQSYYEVRSLALQRWGQGFEVRRTRQVFLRSERVENVVAAGGFSAHDFREVFRSNVEKRIRSLPEIDGLSKETVLNSWMTKFDTIFRGEEDGSSGSPPLPFPPSL